MRRISWAIVSIGSALALVLSLLGVIGPSASAVDGEACRTVGAADLRYDSDDLTGEVVAGVTECFDLPDPAGTVYAHFVDDDAFRLRFLDASGAEACNPVHRICRVTGPPPYRLVVSPTFDGAAGQYAAQVFRTTGDTGCVPGEPLPFGGTDEILTQPPAAERFACWALGLTPGRHLVRTDQVSTWTLLDPAGAQVCADGAPACDVPATGLGGQSVLLAATADFLVTEAPRRAAVTDLVSTEGCEDSLDTRWTADADRLGLVDELQVDCLGLAAEPGDVLYPGGRSVPLTFGVEPEVSVIDPTGAPACEVQPGEQLCEVGAAGPHRAVSFVDVDDGATPTVAYDVAVRVVGADDGCPVLAVDTFGAGPGDSASGIGCRRFTPDRTGDHLVNSVADHNRTSLDEVEGRVYDAELQEVCEPFSRPPGRVRTCQGLAAEPHTLLFDPVGSQAVTSVYDVASSEGCLLADVQLTAYERLPNPAGIDCYTIADTGGEPLLAAGAFGPNETVGFNVVDDGGEYACFDVVDTRSIDACELTGPGPHRFLAFTGTQRDPYSFALSTPSLLATCPELPQGGASGVLPATQRIVCVRVTLGDEVVSTVGLATDVTDGLSLSHTGANADCTPRGGTYFTSRSTQCEAFGRGSGLAVLLLYTNGSEQTVTIRRTDTGGVPDPQPPKIRNTRPPKVAGVRRIGGRLRVKRGTWRPSPDTYRYQWFVNGRKIRGATDRTLRVKKFWRGKKIKVRVRVNAAGAKPARRTSKPVRIKRGR